MMNTKEITMNAATTITVTVAVIETMPEHLRASHRAAGNWGSYPHNGAERSVVPSDDAVIVDDGEYDHVVCEYSATLDDDGISIHDADGHLLGTGTWDGSIVDCPADLGDDVYEALDAALLDAGAPEGDDDDDDDDEADCYVMTVASGATVLVYADSASSAEREWDDAVEDDLAEPRLTSARRATPDEVDACVASGHDYR